MCTSLLARRLISTLLVDKEALLFSPSPCLDYIKQSRGEGETMERGGGETEVVPGRERGRGSLAYRRNRPCGGHREQK